MCANDYFLQDLLRDTWQFQGYVASDCAAIADIDLPYPTGHGYAPNENASCAYAVRAGCDCNCGDRYYFFLYSALQAGLLTEADIDASFTRLTRMQMLLGLFDPKDNQTYFQYGIDQVDTPAHQQLALDAARQSIVLLKNDNNTLPLQRGKTIAVIGPHFNATDVFLSNYHGERCIDGTYQCVQSPVDAITQFNTNGVTLGAYGCSLNGTDVSGIAPAVATASKADVVVLMMGYDENNEGEDNDRYLITLLGQQTKLISAVLAVGKPTVLVLMNGAAVPLGPLKDQIPAIVEAFYPGEVGSQAIAEVLFGDYNPSGKLPITVYPAEYVHQIPMTEMGLRVAPGRTHLFYTGTPEFTFGSGLSYSTWAMQLESSQPPSPAHAHVDVHTHAHAASDSNSRFEMQTSLRSSVSFRVHVELVKGMPGTQRVLAFWRPKNVSAIPDLKQKLFDYQTVPLLQQGQRHMLTFTLTPASMAMADLKGDKYAHAGDYEVAFFDGERELKTLLRVTGESVLVEKFINKSK